jgi:hypothetical protein
MLVSDRDGLDVDERHRQPGALQQRPGIAQVDERRDPKSGTALELEFGAHQRLTQLVQCRATGHRRQKQPVALQRVTHLRQRTGQIVDPVQTEAG